MKWDEWLKKIIKENLKLERFTLPRAEALEFMKDEPYKVRLYDFRRNLKKLF